MPLLYLTNCFMQCLFEKLIITELVKTFLKIHYCVPRKLTLDHILNYLNSVYNFTDNFSKVCFNIIDPSMPSLSNQFLLLDYPPKLFMHSHFPTHSKYPTKLIQFSLINLTNSGKKYKLQNLM